MSQHPIQRTNSDTLPDLIADSDNIDNGTDSSNSVESPSVEEVNSDDFPSYFQERGTRLFHAGDAAYPLPVDTPEVERQTILHEMLRQIHGANYFGPVHEVLSPNPASSRQPRVLDACTGNGRWALDMAEEFPDVHFIGFDHVPIATRYPPRNVRFEIQDVNAPFRWSDQTFDVVHLRATSLAVRNYQPVFHEVSRVLRRGGLLLSSEWSTGIHLEPSTGLSDIITHAPASCQFYNAVNSALASRPGYHSPVTPIAPLLAGTGEWVDISTAVHHVPVGARPSEAASSIGTRNLDILVRYVASIRHVLEDSREWADDGLNRMIRGHEEELRSKDGLATVLHILHARRA